MTDNWGREAEADLALARRWYHSGLPAMMVTVAHTRGSVPRERGTRMLVSADAVAGTVGGGHLEMKAIALARERLATGQRQPLDWPVTLGPSLGQCCGGAVTLNIAPLYEAALAAWPEPAARFHLQLYGAGHVGRALVAVLSQVPCRVTWIDERESEFPATRWPDHIEQVCVDAVTDEVPHGEPGQAYLVMTHSHDKDLAIIHQILRRGDFGYCGLIGSATKRARFLSRLRQMGHPEDTLARLTCPIGLPGLDGKEPGVIAISVAAQLLNLHNLSR